MSLPFIRFVGTRLFSTAVTLLLLTLFAFVGGQLLPGNVGRAILGPLADPRAIATLNHQLGADRPISVQYLDWLNRAPHGDLGTSLVLNRPVASLLFSALARSLELAAFACAMVVPISIVVGIVAALRAGRVFDWASNLIGIALSVVPEFVWSIVLILTLGIWLHWFPIFADISPDTPFATRLHQLTLPALPLGFGLFGYLSRVTRTSTLQALQSHYTRTAVLKGLSWPAIICRHVLRNALPPAITVLGSQLGYLIGGLVTVEALFRYPGVGSLILQAAKTRDFPLLQGGVLVIGALYAIGSLLGDLIARRFDPHLNTETR
ncbi:ABC transporter permease [Paraburkholderia nemoris]|uniref:ABC transporter permease n=1 Tax=Paraburkholderia nemoris TaxID=2793076 RepID=UPI0038B8DDB2